MDAGCLRIGKRLLDGGVDDRLVHGVLLRDGVGDEHTALHAEGEVRLEHGRKLLRRIDTVVNAEAAPAGVEGGQFIGAVADNGHTLGLQILQRQPQIQNGLGAGAHDHDRGGAKLLKVGGNVHRDLRSSVNAADAARGKDLDARHVSDYHRGGDGGSAVGAPCDDGCKVTAACLCDLRSRLAEILDLVGGETRLEAAADYGDGCGDGAVFTDGLFNEQSRFYVFGVGHTVGNYRAFESNDGLALGESLSYFG